MTIRTEPVTINLGPQHPSTHGVFRLRVTFDGEMVVMMVVVMFMDVQTQMHVTMMPMQLWMMVAAKNSMTVVSAVVMV